jgi:glycosyltransferase involved in cell wall biosynthesis
MKIIVFAPFFPPDPTGSSVFAGQQVEELVRRGNEVLVVTNQPDQNAPGVETLDELDPISGTYLVKRLHGARINLGKITWNYGIPVSIFGFLRRAFLSEIRQFNPDAVIVHSTLFDLSLLGILWARRHRKKVIIVSHTALWHDVFIVNFLMKCYGRLVLGPLIRYSRAKVVCVDKWTYENATRCFDKSKNTVTIPVSANLGTMNDGDASKIANKLELTGGPFILSLGHVVPLRNRHNLTRSVPLILKKYPHMKVIVVGMVKDDSFIKLAEELGIREHFVLVGAVRHEEIKDYLAFADIETHDLDGLGLGITSVEAMDAGVPIVAWAVDDNYPQFSLRSYGPSGFINDGNPETIADKIDQIISDENYRATILDSQRRLVDEIYSCKSVTDQYLKLLET